MTQKPEIIDINVLLTPAEIDALALAVKAFEGNGNELGTARIPTVLAAQSAMEKLRTQRRPMSKP